MLFAVFLESCRIDRLANERQIYSENIWKTLQTDDRMITVSAHEMLTQSTFCRKKNRNNKRGTAATTGTSTERNGNRSDDNDSSDSSDHIGVRTNERSSRRRRLAIFLKLSTHKMHESQTRTLVLCDRLTCKDVFLFRWQ